MWIALICAQDARASLTTLPKKVAQVTPEYSALSQMVVQACRCYILNIRASNIKQILALFSENNLKEI